MHVGESSTGGADVSKRLGRDGLLSLQIRVRVLVRRAVVSEKVNLKDTPSPLSFSFLSVLYPSRSQSAHSLTS